MELIQVLKMLKLIYWRFSMLLMMLLIGQMEQMLMLI